MVAADEFELGAPAMPPAAPPPHTPRPLSSRGSTWGVIGAALILVGVMVAPGPQPPSLEDGIAWNILELDLTTEPTVSWTVPSLTTAPVPGEVLGSLDNTLIVSLASTFTTVDAPAPGPGVVALDAETGAERWRIDQPCLLGGGVLTCVEDPGSPGALVTTVESDGSARAAVTHPEAMAARGVDGGGMLVLEGGTTDLAELVRVDAWGAELWRARLDFSGLADSGYWWLDVVDDTVSTGSRWFDLASGGELDLWTDMQAAPDGTVRHQFEDGSAVFTLLDGREVRLPPDELWLEIDDALGGPVSLHDGTDGAAVATWEGGSSLFQLPDNRTCAPDARLQGVVLSHCLPIDGAGGFETLAIDQLTGETLWKLTENFWYGPLQATADTLLVRAPDGLMGIDPRTGQTRWSIPMPGQNPDVTPVDDYLVVWTSEALIRLD